MTLLAEIQEKCPQALIDAREHGAIAALVSAGRTRVVETEIGNGTILEVLGLAAGNALLDLINTNADFRHVKPLVEQGRLRLDSPLVIATLQSLVPAVLTQSQVDALLARSVIPAPVGVQEVIEALKGV